MFTEEEEGVFESVAWGTAGEVPSTSTAPVGPSSTTDDIPSSSEASASANGDGERPRRRSTGASERPQWQGYLLVEVRDPVKELEGTKDQFVSYMVVGKTDLPIYDTRTTSARRRFQDFAFLHDHLVKDFPAAVVPPLPNKSRLKYVTGDRFSPEFVERRRADLQRFLERLARHPTLSRSTLLRSFLCSTEWTIVMHTHLAHPPLGPDHSAPSPTSLLEMASDTLLNAFSKVRKPDERFVEIKEGLERFEERVVAVERIEGRSRGRITDLAGDYEDLAASIQGLGYLESGITEPLARFESALLDFSIGLRDLNTSTTTPFLHRLSSMLNYSDSLRQVLKLRDQKQLDFEDLSAYLSNITTERDRLAAGYGGLGLGSYLKERIDGLRGGDAEGGREGKIFKLDGKIKDLQDAVLTAHETSDAFNDQVLQEHSIFQKGKRSELRDHLTELADGHIAMYKKSIQDWEGIIPHFEKIRVDS